MKDIVARAKVPGSSANLGPGFDTLGIALDVYAQIEMQLSDQTVVEMQGDDLKELPADETNLVYQVARTVFEAAEVKPPPLRIKIQSDIPLTRGLGSSAAAIVGGMACANALLDQPLSDQDIFQLATELEKHPDNVGASLFGGIVVTQWDGGKASCIRIEPDPRLEILAAVPEFHLETKIARGLLPEKVTREDAIFNIGHSSLLVAALCSGRLDLIGRAMKDRMHQPYRSKMIPGMPHILNEAEKRGALGVALSGAGPTLLAFVDKQSKRKAELEQFMIDTFEQESVAARTMWLKPDLKGVQVTESKEKD